MMMLWVLGSSIAALGVACVIPEPADRRVSETPGAVPAAAPDTTPAWFQDDSSYNQDKVVRQALAIGFTRGATIGQRQAAIDSVRATVTGGAVADANDPGLYYIKVPGAVSLDSLEALTRVLRRQPGVRLAIVLTRVRENWRKPYDKAVWRPDSFSLDPSTAVASS
ncbi:MAG: hypothetical protein ACRENB_16350 [Gemmatimonadales bacterium]